MAHSGSRINLYLIVFCLLRGTAFASGSAPQTESDRSYECHKVAEGTIHIDGLADEPGWEKAELLERFQTSGPHPQPAKAHTEARLLWSDDALYASFFCGNDAIRAVGEERDGEVWTGDAAEIFLAPGGGDMPYFEIDINPKGVIYDNRITDWHYEVLSKHWREWAEAYTADIRCAISEERGTDGSLRGWRVEVRIPFKDLVPESAFPTPGTVWLFDVARAGKLGSGPVEFSVWEPTRSDFHRPYRYPRLLFVQ